MVFTDEWTYFKPGIYLKRLKIYCVFGSTTNPAYSLYTFFKLMSAKQTFKSSCCQSVSCNVENKGIMTL